MADVNAPSLGVKAIEVTEEAGKVLGNTARAIGQSVVDDGKNLVGRDVPLGTRIEAGVNVAADVAAFVVGPEDIVAERAGVFAIKEGVEHASQVVEVGEVAGKALAEELPEIGKVVASDYERTKGLIEKAGHELVDSRPEKGILETGNAIYKVIEQGVRHGEGIVGDVGAAGREAFEKSKNFAVHAEKLPEALENGIKNLGQAGYHELKGLKATLSTSAMQIEKSIAEVEHSPAVRGVAHTIEKVNDKIEKAIAPLETGGKLLEYGKKAVELGKTALEHKKEIIELGVGGAYVAKEFGGAISDEAHRLTNAAGHAVFEAKTGLQHAEKAISHDIKTWTPEMPFEQFGALINRVRGVGAHSNDLKQHTVAQGVAHEPVGTPPKSKDLGHGH